MNSFNKEDWRFDSLPRSSNYFDPDASIFAVVESSTTVSILTRYGPMTVLDWPKYNCRLCGHSAEETFTENEMNRHCLETQHYNCVQVLLDNKQKNSDLVWRHVSEADKIMPRVEQLGLSVWQIEIQSYLFQWICNAGTTTPSIALSLALSLLHKYERMELSSLIELAAWKHSCLLAGTPNPKSSQMTSYLGMKEYMKEWESHGWKKNKTAMRRSVAIQVIVSNVLAFIDANDALPTESSSTTNSTTNRKRRRHES